MGGLNPFLHLFPKPSRSAEEAEAERSVPRGLTLALEHHPQSWEWGNPQSSALFVSHTVQSCHGICQNATTEAKFIYIECLSKKKEVSSS